MYSLITYVYLAAMATGVWLFVDLYLFKFDEHSEEELIKLSLYWAPSILFGLLGLIGRACKGIKDHVLFAVAGTLIGVAGLAFFLMLVFL